MLRVGVIGLGVGQNHFRAYQAHPQCEVGLVCDFDPARLREFSERHPVTAVTAEAGDVLNSPDIDLVSIASYDNYHLGQTVGALLADKHVFVEKPICLTREELWEITAVLGAKPGLRLSSNLPLRTAPRFARVREAIRAGDFGPVYHLEGDYFWGRTEKLTRGWRTEMDFYSIIHGAAIHLVDLLTWMTGLWPVSAAAAGNRISTREGRLKYNDFAVLLLNFSGGLTAKVSAHGGCVHPHFHRVAVFGRDRTFFNEDGNSRWVISSDPREPSVPDRLDYPARDRRSVVIHSFIDSILDPEIAPLVTARETIRVMDICLAAEDSVASGTPKTISYTVV